MSNDEAIKILEHLRDTCATFNIDDHSDEEALDIAIIFLKKDPDENIKKDLKGRQKKIEKLMAENYVLANRLEVAEDNLNDERTKNVRLYSKYVVALKELAQYKKKEEVWE